MGSFHRTLEWMMGILVPSKGIKYSHAVVLTVFKITSMNAVSNGLCCYPLTYTNRWAWGNVSDAVPGQSEEPGVAENNVSGSHRAGCRLLLGCTTCRRKKGKCQVQNVHGYVGLAIFFLF